MKESWSKCKFDNVVDVVSGRNQKDVVSNSGKYPIYGSGGIIGRANNYLSRENTTIIGRKGNINSPIYVKEKFWNIDTAFGLESKPILESKFLFYYCLGFNFKQLDKSTAVPSLAKRDILNIDIPLPPLPEQRSIVAKIEHLFSELDNGIANLKTAQEQLKVYWQAVLKKAFEGGLTNIKMTWSKLGKECNIIMGQSPPGISYNNQGVGVPLINGPVEFGEGPLGKTVKSKWTTKPTKLCKRGDLILCVRGSTTGKTNIADFDACVGRGVAAIRYADNQEYLNSYMLFKRYEIYSKGTGTTFPSVSSKELSEFNFPICSIKEQNKIVQQIESRLSVCDKVEETITVNLQKAEALRQSILKKAFAGELLTEAEIAACKKEKDWEPAGELLKRIEKD